MTRSETIRSVSESFDLRRRNDEQAHDDRIKFLSEKIPEFGEITKQLSTIGLRVFEAAVYGRNTEDVMKRIRTESEELRRRRGDVLENAGYPRDFADRRYRCEKCADSGFVGLNMCSCMRREIILAELESSGLGKLADSQTFSTFNMKYYQGQDATKMKYNAECLYRFAQNFDRSTSESFLLIGPTGLGKTHLSTSVALTVIEKGYDVLYRTAHEVMTVFERQRFGNGSQGDGTERAFFESQLLIIDDLGTEVTTQYTVSWLYDILNSRINAKLPTIINTNLSKDELYSRYAERITSRLFGVFKPLVFVGRDIRLQKLG